MAVVTVSFCGICNGEANTAHDVFFVCYGFYVDWIDTVTHTAQMIGLKLGRDWLNNQPIEKPMDVHYAPSHTQVRIPRRFMNCARPQPARRTLKTYASVDFNFRENLLNQPASQPCRQRRFWLLKQHFTGDSVAFLANCARLAIRLAIIIASWFRSLTFTTRGELSRIVDGHDLKLPFSLCLGDVRLQPCAAFSL